MTTSNFHFVPALPNALQYHKFKGLDTNVVYECKTSPMRVEDGLIQVPSGPCSGVDIDPDFVGKHKPV